MRIKIVEMGKKPLEGNPSIVWVEGYDAPFIPRAAMALLIDEIGDQDEHIDRDLYNLIIEAPYMVRTALQVIDADDYADQQLISPSLEIGHDSYYALSDGSYQALIGTDHMGGIAFSAFLGVVNGEVTLDDIN